MTVSMQRDAGPAPKQEVSRSAAENLLVQVALAHATDLARNGRFLNAEQALGVCGTGSHFALDLLARMRAQQGRLAEAQSLWNEAIKLDPGNESYRAALDRLARINRRSYWRFDLKWLAKASLALALASLCALLVQRWWRAERAGMTNEIRAMLQPPVSANPPQLSQEIKGIHQVVEGGTLALDFDYGLFLHADVISVQGKNALEELGIQLRPQAHRLLVSVVGFSDSLPVSPQSRYRSNHFLALARADAAARVLASSSGIPFAHIDIRSAEGPLYPNDTRENRAHNRTVEVRISTAPHE